MRRNWQMIAFWLEAILVGHIAQRDDVALGIAVAVGAGLDQDELFVLIDHLTIAGLRLGYDDLLQVANVLHSDAIRCLITERKA